MRRPIHFIHLALAIFTLALVAAPAGASAKEAVDYFGTQPTFPPPPQGDSGSLGGEFNGPTGIAVNQSGAGPANPGDIYVADTANNRIERFARNDNGTPADGKDDTYTFISAWGADVAAPKGASDYEICTVAANCKAAVASAGNSTPAGNGSLSKPGGVAVDEDSGRVYVSDRGNNRVNVYEGDGSFVRSFGYEAVASGPGVVPGATEQQQLTVKATGGKFSLIFRGETTGAIGTGDIGNASKIITNVITSSGAFEVGQAFNSIVGGDKNFPDGTTIAAVDPGKLTLSLANTNTNRPNTLYGSDLPHNASAAEVETALNSLPTIGGVGGSVAVTGGPGDLTGTSPYTITFGGSLAGKSLPPIEPVGGTLTSAETASATIATTAEGGAFEVCTASLGDVCQAGTSGAATGQIAGGGGIAVSQPDGNPATGTVFLADGGNRRVDTFSIDGSGPGAIGSSAVFTSEEPDHVAVDSRGILYASNQSNESEVERYDTENANGGGIGFLAPIAAPPLSPSPGFGSANRGLVVDPDSDGAGPDTDVLYVLRTTAGGVQQLGPVNQPGLTTPPTAVDAVHGATSSFLEFSGLALDQPSGRLYVTSRQGGDQQAEGVYVLGDPAGPPPVPALDSLSDITASSVRAHGSIDPNGPPATSYHLEYSTDGVNWFSTPSVVLGSQEDPVPVEPLLDPPPFSLEPNTFYHVRLVAKRPLYPGVVSSELTFTTLAAQPSVETVGTPIRTASTAQLSGRVNPRNSATEYHFEYGDQGPCDANPCQSTPSHAAGSGKEVKFATEQIEGLQPAITYHYRLVADSGNPGGPVFGSDMTVTTRATDAPLSHGHFPGPPGSDRAYEQVSLPDASGNPVGSGLGFSEDGNRALYSINGGTPITDNGTATNYLFAERNVAGWQSSQITPPRSQTIGNLWLLTAASDLATVVGANFPIGKEMAIWQLSPGGASSKLFQTGPGQGRKHLPVFGVSADGSREVMHLAEGSPDPAYPTATGGNLYDISSGGPPHLVSLLPGDVHACVDTDDVPEAYAHWISADGSRVYFPSRGSAPSCNGPTELYMRDIEAGQSKLLSGPVVSGADCGGALIRSTEDAVFFWSQSRLVAEDTEPAACGAPLGGVVPLGGDVYRYALGDQSLQCLTCVVAGLDADVFVTFPSGSPATSVNIGVAPDSSRVYFKTNAHLLPGAPPDGQFAGYRVDVATGDLAYVAPLEVEDRVGQTGGNGNALSADGSVFVFRSDSPKLNPLGGAGNGDDTQYYRYDDRDRSLVCVSCRADGGSVEGVPGPLVPLDSTDLSLNPASEDGSTIAFITSNPLVGADQNTPGTGGNPAGGQDVYEWRDGRILLVTDGLTKWPANGTDFEGPILSGVSRSGKDVYFTAPIQYTPDALDGYRRLYDARIDGGIVFPPPPKPCPLEVCQGTPKGAPEEQAPGTGSFSGLGNKTQAPATRCRKSQRRVSRNGSARCVAKHKKKHSAKKQAKQASDNRRTAR